MASSTNFQEWRNEVWCSWNFDTIVKSALEHKRHKTLWLFYKKGKTELIYLGFEGAN